MGSAPKEVIDLIEQFERNIESYKEQGYNEAQVRQQFINPFFESLGWDMQNKAGIAPAYSDVIHEDAIKVGGTTKAPDYCFRIGGTRKFFLEAKKPSVDIKSDISPAYQLRRYAWSAKLPLSILTDFEEFAVYDCQVRPSPDDKPSTGRIMLFTYKDYADKWEQIANIFSKEAVYKGLFDKYASEKTAKRGTTTVDKEFLAEIEQWRNELAKNIALRNGKLSVYDLNFAVQKTIDRILFLRICEDRGIERGEQLLGLISGSRIYPRLFELFEKSDERYNSGIFHFHREKDRPEGPDELSANLKIDDDVLTRILKDLYYPRSPYEFSVMPAEILGNVYEQFLGKVIRLTESHQAKVEEKPEVKKAGGVYYTPAYIVDYIVKNTVGKLLGCPCEERSDEAISNKLKTKNSTLKTPAQVAHLRILDPACGSGSFLIGAYQYLLDFHRDYYAKEPSKHKKAVYQGKSKQWFLTIDEKKKILLNNIYGVDIDSQAAEVTKLSLLLKVLENETQESLRLFHERALPDLGNNIKCGNSLIGPDFYQKQQLTLFDDQQQRKINAFDWQKEFAPIFKQGGFDAVIGNPPYIRIQTLNDTQPDAVEYFGQRYISGSKGNYDIYVLFVEKGLSLLNKLGKLGFILPHKFFNSNYGEPLRNLIAEEKHLSHVVHFGDQQVFAGATTYTCLLFLNKSRIDKCEVVKVSKISDWLGAGTASKGFIPCDSISGTEWNFSIGHDVLVLEKLKKMPAKLDNIADIFVGTQTSADDIFVLDDCDRVKNKIIGFSQSLQKKVEVEAGCVVPFLRGKEIRSYEPLRSTSYLLCPYEISKQDSRLLTFAEMQKKFPLTLAYFESNKTSLKEREKGKFNGENWYAFGYPKSMTLFQNPKIVVPDYNNVASFTFDTEGHFYKTGYGVIVRDGKLSPLYVLGLLNSSLLFKYLCSIATSLRGGYVRFWRQFLKQLPIRTIDFSNRSEKAKHDKMVSFVEQMLDLNKKLAGIKNPDEKTRIQRQIDSTDEQIDNLVYDLYGLTPEEIAIVEGGNN